MSGQELRFNPKRAVREWLGTPEEARVKAELAARVKYAGNPQHKRDPGDFFLTPPAAPRQNATLCDDAGVSRKAEASNLLRTGVEAGLISERTEQGYPAQIWAVRDDGVVFEAQLENAGMAQYHGYPMPAGDPFRSLVLARAKA